MKTWSVILKILAALAAIAGIIYALATYGDKIVAWCKMLLDKLNLCCCCNEPVEAPVEADETVIEADDHDFEAE